MDDRKQNRLKLPGIERLAFSRGEVVHSQRIDEFCEWRVRVTVEACHDASSTPPRAHDAPIKRVTSTRGLLSFFPSPSYHPIFPESTMVVAARVTIITFLTRFDFQAHASYPVIHTSSSFQGIQNTRVQGAQGPCFRRCFLSDTRTRCRRQGWS